MPLRITKIEIDNYRAFYGTGNVVALPKGENLLVYGENGSGKTSLYRAVKDFFEQEMADFPPELEWHFHAKTEPQIRLTFANFENGKLLEGSEITFKNAEAAGVIADTDEDDSEERRPVFDAELAKGFFSYRELLATHLSDFGEEIDLFKLLMEKVLRNWVEPGTGERFFEFWATIEDRIYFHGLTGSETKQELDHLESIEQKARQDLEEFQLRLEASLQLLEPEMNAFLRYFNHNIEVVFDLKKFNPDDVANDNDQPQVFLKTQFYGHELERHQESLNEARLSALAISIFLASVKNNPADPNALKVLFLDDIFLGLDMGNRLPLLHILNDHFQEYQIFLTTYDRAWFEVARQHLKGNWKQIEMFPVYKKILWEGEGEEPPLEFEFEQPLILDPALDYFEKANLYFQKKDYPTCANFQRKWCEQFLKKYLQENYRLEILGDEQATEITKLNTLFGRLEKFYKDCKIELPAGIKSEFHLHRDTVMNPFSHDDLQSPVYRQELERGFRLIEELKKLKPLRKSVIAYRGDIIEYVEPRLNYSCRFQITTEPLSLVNHGGDISILGKGDVLDFTENEETTSARSAANMKDLEVNEFCEKILHYFVEKKAGFTPNPDQFEALVLNPQKITLRQIIDG